MTSLVERLRVLQETYVQPGRADLTLEERARLKGLDPYEVVERAAIMEYDGGVSRERAEAYALSEREREEL